MWCDYACNADKAGWIEDGGEREATPPLTGMWRNVNTVIDSDYACGIFTSCAKESYISQSGISSAKAFLDFMGTNGAPFSLSWINFELLSDSTKETAMQGTEDEDWYPCEYPVPANHTLNSYDVAYNTTCSYCDAACQPPVVDDKIAFLDGLSWKIVGYSYMAFVLFTIAFQVLLKFCCEKKATDDIRTELENAEADSSSAANGRPYTGQQRAQGRPLNVTDDHSNSRDVSGRLEDDR